MIGEKNNKLMKYDNDIHEVYDDPKIGYTTHNGLGEGMGKVIRIIDKIKRDKDINVLDFIDYIDYLRENGVI